jgi:hypothetical protein
MLVLIVVAAAVTFSFYIASTEQTTLAERTALHLKNLENVTIQAVDILPGENVTLVLASSDIYNTSITDIAINGNPAVSYCVPPGNATIHCNSAPTYPEFPVAGGSNYLTLLPFSVTPVTLNDSNFFLQPFVISPTEITVSFGTVRGNEFVESLLPPVGRLGIQYAEGWPILDGSASFQPHGGSFPNASVNAWNWTVQATDSHGNVSDPDNGVYNGEQVQLPFQFVPGGNYTLRLTVTNTLGLSATTFEVYSAPG